MDSAGLYTKDVGAHYCEEKKGHILVIESEQEQNEVISAFGISSECHVSNN